MVDKGAVDPNLIDPAGILPLEIAIRKNDDALANSLASRMDEKSLEQNRFLGEAVVHGLDKTADTIAAKMKVDLYDGEGKNSETYDFYRDPLGDGVSVLGHMVQNPDLFNKEGFRRAYGIMKNNLGKQMNPMELQTAFQANLLESAALRGNAEALHEILNIMQEEGFLKHIAVLRSNSDTVIPVLMIHKQGGELTQAIGENFARLSPDDRKDLAVELNSAMRAAKRGGVVQEVKVPLEGLASGTGTPKALEGGDSATGSSTLAKKNDLPDILILDGEGGRSQIVSGGKVYEVSGEFEEEHIKKIKNVIEPKKMVAKREADAEELRRTKGENKDGIAEEKKPGPMEKAPRIEVPFLKQSALLGGYFASQVITSRAGLGYLLLMTPGIDSVVAKETIEDATQNHELAWGAAYFATALSQAYGGQNSATTASVLKAAGLATLGYGIGRAFRPSTSPKDLPPSEERSVWDFATRFGPSMGVNVAFTALSTGLNAMLLSGTLMLAGPSAFVNPVVMSIASDFLQYYNAYASEGKEAEKDQSLLSSLTPVVVGGITALMYYRYTSAHYLQGVDTTSHGMQIVQNLFTTFSVAMSAMQMSSLVLDNFGIPLGQKVVEKASTSYSWIYEKIFGPSTAHEGIPKEEL